MKVKKGDLVQMLSGKDIKYQTMNYEERLFEPVAPGLVLMRGRVRAHLFNHGKESDV